MLVLSDAGGTYLAAGIEHTVEGHPTADTTVHQEMNASAARRRRRRVAPAPEAADLPPGDAG